MSEISFDLEGLRNGYRDGRFTPVDVAAEALKRIAAYRDPAVWISRADEAAVMARAEALVERRDDLDVLPLYGVPFAVKDNIDCAGLPTTAACPSFAYAPEADANVVARLLGAGAILLGKTNLDQFATGLVGTRSPYGAPRCVFDDRYISGGSSSGSAVAVAAGLVSFALGTDTAGSGRVPAAFNNIVGVKPSKGLVSTRGVVPACRSLDCVSVLALTVGDGDRVLGVAEGWDAADSFSRKLAQTGLPRTGFRFGVLKSADLDLAPELTTLYEGAATRLEALGGTPVAFDYAPFAAAAQLLYGGAFVAERLAAIRSFMEAHEAEMDASVRAIIAGARAYDAASAFEAEYRLAELRRETDAIWAQMDVMLLPTAPEQFTVEEIAADPISRNSRLGRFTNFVNLLDSCAVAVPAGFSAKGLAFGVTLVAPAGTDHALAALADRLHRAAPAGLGANRNATLPGASIMHETSTEDRVELFVVGAHLRGMPLNRELAELGAGFVREIRTAPGYHLYVLPGTTPPKPGLVYRPGDACDGIAGEVWSLTPEAFGRFVAKIPQPLGIGKVKLENDSRVSGFLCEAYAVEGAQDITAFGGWRRYVATR
ncbi:MAG: allophanate hydrolase [Rhizomicrobium sp.]